jgi:hypothetical protein
MPLRVTRQEKKVLTMLAALFVLGILGLLVL